MVLRSKSSVLFAHAENDAWSDASGCAVFEGVGRANTFAKGRSTQAFAVSRIEKGNPIVVVGPQAHVALSAAAAGNFSYVISYVRWRVSGPWELLRDRRARVTMRGAPVAQRSVENEEGRACCDSTARDRPRTSVDVK